MKQWMVGLLLAMAVMLTGCREAGAQTGAIIVSLARTQGCRILSGSVEVPSGGDAEFSLELEEGYRWDSLDYDGEYALDIRGDQISLCLYDVRYPTVVQVKLTRDFCAVTYEPNGGTGGSYTQTYDCTLHRRPNTALGTDVFSREGYTLNGWNTEPDGSGTDVSLGSRVTVEENENLVLYAQWAAWAQERDFRWETVEDGVRITGYLGNAQEVVVPARLSGLPVRTIGADAFRDSPVVSVILPETLEVLEDGAFAGSKIRELTLFDNIQQISDAVFQDCRDLETLRIHAAEPPYGYVYRQESCFADKVDLLIHAQGQQKAVFYGGCSMWYNLDGALAQEALGTEYQVINMGLNGVINSEAQMQIIAHFLEEGDIFFHTPELSSEAQMMLRKGMINHDRKLWSGLENNYDLVSLLDLRQFPAFFDCFQYWLSRKEEATSYESQYLDSRGNGYLDSYGCIPFLREETRENLVDGVYLDTAYLEPEALARLDGYYQQIRSGGTRVYVSFACVNLDALPQEQQGNVAQMEEAFRQAVAGMEGVTLVGQLSDYLYHNEDFYDTNYHLLTAPARRNTQQWMQDLTRQLEQDGVLHPTT